MWRLCGERARKARCMDADAIQFACQVPKRGAPRSASGKDGLILNPSTPLRRFYVQPTEAATLSLMGAGAVPMGGVTALSAFALDGTPPVATLTASPAAILASNSTVANFTSNEAGSTFTCTYVWRGGPGRDSPHMFGSEWSVGAVSCS